MSALNLRMLGAGFVFSVHPLSMTPTVERRAQAPSVDLAAAQMLQRTTEYLGGLEQFSAHTRNEVEDQLESTQRIDTVVPASPFRTHRLVMPNW